MSGGGARGFAHIGVIKALEEIGFFPDLIVGTSIGALVGALYASGNTPAEIESYVANTRWAKLVTPQPFRDIEFVSQKIMDLPELFTLRFDENFNVVFPRNLLSTQGLQERIFHMTIYPEYQAGSNFDSLAIPLRIVATDIKKGKAVVLKNGNLARSVTASSAFPIVLAPVAIGPYLLADGGLTNNVPIDVAKELGADFIVAVDVSSKVLPLTEHFDVFDIFGQAMNTLAYLSDTKNLDMANVLIRPVIDDITSADFDSLSTLVNAGYRSCQDYLEQIRPYATHVRKSPDYIKKAIDNLNHTTINRIRFSSDQSTREYILRREVQLKEGSLWNLALAKRSMKNLFSTGLFKNVYLSLSKVDSNRADLLVEVEENERTSFSFGARYDSERKASAFIAGKYRNLLGVGLDNQVNLIVSDLFTRTEWNARTTRIFISNFTGYTSLYYLTENVPLFNNGRRIETGEFNRTGFEGNAGIQVKRVGLTAFGFKYERTRVDSMYTTNYSIPKTDYSVGSLTLRIFVDNTDNPDLPKSGRVNDIRYEHSVEKDRLKQFDRVSVESVTYETFDDKYTYSTIIRFGYINSVLSHYEQFRLGGLTSLPGYHQDELWGSMVGVIGLGFRAPLASGVYYRLAGMVGNVWNGFSDFDWKESRAGIRAGIVIPTPIGPISCDYGYGFNNRRVVYVSVGHNF
ncbi:MAG: patatin-like phospholipase family protein [Candidatus Neomarinimicrobiota bacterium]